MLKSHPIAAILVLAVSGMSLIPPAHAQMGGDGGGTAGEPLDIPIVVAPPATPEPLYPTDGGAQIQNDAVGVLDGGDGFFQLPNFIGDTREEDSHYNTMHQYPFPAWDTYQQVLTNYVQMARAQGAVAYPPPPYSQYNYVAGDMTVGPGGPVTPPQGSTPTFVNGSSGVSVNPNNGDVTGVGSASGTTTATTSVSGQVVTPGLVGQ
jgi:hypothetical protein